ncbi:hypothetical protein K503DRAFT_116798 [Rhizopogon vinicolor AM-OR11-026]|uniref:Uncharacterized protein n=1 Tax=Rhizopogon vinicolor AM-OR11-026 TaxID=1314800 RepID=A0A1B7MEV6_9AGAM|nr:hypothetical protein K503DRAFT_116798 [Rhizopogon vinicolor AM-OR11-026]
MTARSSSIHAFPLLPHTPSHPLSTRRPLFFLSLFLILFKEHTYFPFLFPFYSKREILPTPQPVVIVHPELNQRRAFTHSHDPESPAQRLWFKNPTPTPSPSTAHIHATTDHPHPYPKPSKTPTPILMPLTWMVFPATPSPPNTPSMPYP